MGTNTELYAHDFYAWCHRTAALLRAGQWYDLDVEAVAEEIESLGTSQHRELGSRLDVLSLHLLKWRYQPEGRHTGHQPSVLGAPSFRAEGKERLPLQRGNSPRLLRRKIPLA